MVFRSLRRFERLLNFLWHPQQNDHATFADGLPRIAYPYACKCNSNSGVYSALLQDVERVRNVPTHPMCVLLRIDCSLASLVGIFSSLYYSLRRLTVDKSL